MSNSTDTKNKEIEGTRFVYPPLADRMPGYLATAQREIDSLNKAVTYQGGYAAITHACPRAAAEISQVDVAKINLASLGITHDSNATYTGTPGVGQNGKQPLTGRLANLIKI